MKRQFILISAFIICSFASAWSQQKLLSDVFVDTDIVDIQGVTHRPYDQLNAGKIVFINIFSAACGPCWEYHEENTLQEIYELHGPDGSNQIEILSIEGNLNTYPEDLAGTGINTLGDFISCSSYPLFDDHYFPFNLGIHSFPTLLYVCPDKKVYQIPYLDKEELTLLIETGCPDNYAYNNLDLLYFSCDLSPTCAEQDYAQTLVVQNNGHNTVEHISLAYSINGQTVSDSIGFDLFLEQFETVEIPLGIGSISESAEMEVNVLQVNGILDTFSAHNEIEAIKPVIKTETAAHTIEITTDAFGYEIYWEILNGNDAIVAWGGNELVSPGAQQPAYDLLASNSYYASDVTVIEEFYLNDFDCYKFRIYDDYGDGICCNFGEGNFTIRDSNGRTIVDNQLFLAELEVEFLFDPTFTSATTEILENTVFSVFPNPCTTNQLQAEFSSNISTNTIFSVYNAQGQLVGSHPQAVSVGNNKFSLEVEDLETGIYFLSAPISEELITNTFSVIRE